MYRMLPSSSFLVLLLATYTSAASLGARTIQRSSKATDVNLVEFAIRDTIHGKCQYTDKSGRDISLIYEEQNDAIKARSLNKFVVDPVASVRECRAAATEVPKIENLEGRSTQQDVSESAIELRARFNKYATTNKENKEFVRRIEPRFLTWLGKMFMGLNVGSSAGSNFGLSWGGSDPSTDPFPGINLVSPNNNNHLTTTYGSTNPFDFLSHHDNEGPWGVLNSISGNSGLFGLGGLGGLNYPFGIFGK